MFSHISNIIFFLIVASISLLFCIACIVESDWSGFQDVFVFVIGVAFTILSFYRLFEEIEPLFKARQRKNRQREKKEIANPKDAKPKNDFVNEVASKPDTKTQEIAKPRDTFSLFSLGKMYKNRVFEGDAIEARLAARGIFPIYSFFSDHFGAEFRDHTLDDIEWLREAAEEGNAKAQNNHAVLYSCGVIPQNFDEAVKWYRLAAEQGDAKAQTNYALMHSRGKGVPQDDVEAVKWYRLAAEQGDAVGRVNLGYIHENGIGVPQDFAKALKWYCLAAEQGDANAQNNYALMHSRGKGVPQDDAEAVKWYRLAAEQGDVPAQYNLGVMYYNGEGVPKDVVEALKWYHLAAEQEYAFAQYNLGYMYYNGEGVPKDVVEALKWYHLAANKGDKDAKSNEKIIKKDMTKKQIDTAMRLELEWRLSEDRRLPREWFNEQQ